MGGTWYTWLEQGRDVRASLDVLEALARALRLTAAERAHLLLLGRGEAPPPSPRDAERPMPRLRRLVENLGPNPAWLLGRRWDLLAWNAATAAVFGDPAAVPRSRRNLLWLHFTDPARRELHPDWEAVGRRFAAKFRADSTRNMGDPAFEELIAALHDVSPEFAAAWRRHDVERGGGGRVELHHPLAGTLVFESAVLTAEGHDEQRLVLYSPLAEQDTPAKLAGLLDR